MAYTDKGEILQEIDRYQRRFDKHMAEGQAHAAANAGAILMELRARLSSISNREFADEFIHNVAPLAEADASRKRQRQIEGLRKIAALGAEPGTKRCHMFDDGRSDDALLAMAVLYELGPHA